MKSIPVTVVIPVLNEERNLKSCLSTLSRFDAVVVVDSGSSDQTLDIAHEAGATVLKFSWNGSFPKKRNWALATHNFTTEWVLFLDADEHITSEFCDEVSLAIAEGTYSGFWITYDNYFLGSRLKFGVPQRKLALFRVGKGQYERIDEVRWSRLDMEVHEHPVISGPVSSLRSRLLHREGKDVEGHIDRHNQYSSWEAARYLDLKQDSVRWSMLTTRQRLKYRLVANKFSGLAYFMYAYIFRAGILDGAAGFHYAILKCIYFYEIGLKIREQILGSHLESKNTSDEGSAQMSNLCASASIDDPTLIESKHGIAAQSNQARYDAFR